jgi:hypothetical protein
LKAALLTVGGLVLAGILYYVLKLLILARELGGKVEDED